MEAQRLPQETVLRVMENFQELARNVGAEPYQRTPNRRGGRGGHYQRRLTTRYGTVEHLKVPRPAEGGMEFTVFNRYERRKASVH